MDSLVLPVLERVAASTDFEGFVRWNDTHMWVPVVAVTVYVLLIRLVPLYMKNSEPFHLERINTLWNISLSIFSFIGAYYCWPRLIEILTSNEISGLTPEKENFFYAYKNQLTDASTMSPGFKRNTFLKSDGTYGIRGSFDTSVCAYRDDIYRRGVVGLLNQAFYISKYFELFDTVLLVLQKKRVIFLHWFHHVTVLLYCAHAWSSPAPGGVWFATINLTVHTIMYAYYFLASIRLHHVIAPYAWFITVLQILQMIMGTFIAVYTSYKFQMGDGCDTTIAHSQLTLGMYFTYLILFSNFFIQRYVFKNHKMAKYSSKSKKM